EMLVQARGPRGLRRRLPSVPEGAWPRRGEGAPGGEFHRPSPGGAKLRGADGRPLASSARVPPRIDPGARRAVPRSPRTEPEVGRCAPVRGDESAAAYQPRGPAVYDAP